MSTNKKDKKPSPLAETARNVAAVFGVQNAVDKAPGQLLGYHDVYHGTQSNSKVDSIRDKGLKKSKGGTGVSIIDDKTINGGTSNHAHNAKGHVFFSKSRDQANHYTQTIFGPDPKNVAHAIIPHSHYADRSIADPLSKALSPKYTPDVMAKHMAARSDKSISPAQIKGSSKYKGVKQYATGKNMKKYLSNKSGVARFGLGLANAAAGAVGAHRLVGVARERLSSKSK